MDYEKMYFSKVEMSQTVPTGISYTPDPYAVYADSFDLSLLPSSSSSLPSNDGEVPLSPQSELISPSSQSPLVSLDYIPATIYHDHQSIKVEKPWNQEDTDTNHKSTTITTATTPISHNSNISAPQPSPIQQQQQTSPADTSILLQQLQKHYQFYPSPLPSPPQDSPPSVVPATIFPPSPCPSIEQNFPNFPIKQEFHILPPSPPESIGAPSPACSDIKSEPETDTEALIDINSLLEKSIKLVEQQPPTSQQSQPPKKPAQDHQLLREYLQDTSFQKKHNLKPLALESLIGGLGVRGDIEPVISLALEYAKRDAQATCAILKISPDPQQWTTSQVHAWIRSTIEQFKLPPINDIEMKFPEDGATLVCLTEEEFQRRAPEAGGTIHAQLEIWKLACSESFPSDVTSSIGGPSTSNWNSDCTQNMDISDDEDEDMIPTSASSVHHHNHNTATGSTVVASIENGITSTPVAATTTITATTTVGAAGGACIGQTTTTTLTTAVPTTKSGTRPGGSHIHLWQFLKELLASPQVHGTAIRWLDRNKGVFKIEDSVRVAKLWGRRKNRPAMNYDKLSRSIRQYYKKGIMKKTERSQRLVYQFCHPYCL